MQGSNPNQLWRLGVLSELRELCSGHGGKIDTRLAVMSFRINDESNERELQYSLTACWFSVAWVLKSLIPETSITCPSAGLHL